MRDSQGRFLPGHSGNVRGRGLRGSAIKDMLVDLLAEKSQYKPDITRKKSILLKLIHQAEGGCTKSAEIVLSRLEGRPAVTLIQEERKKDTLEVVDGDVATDNEEIRIIAW